MQTIHRQLTPGVYTPLNEWYAMTGVPLLLNTSFNEKEPIVETPEDALNTMKRVGVEGLFFADIGILASPENAEISLAQMKVAFKHGRLCPSQAVIHNRLS